VEMKHLFPVLSVLDELHRQKSLRINQPFRSRGKAVLLFALRLPHHPALHLVTRVPLELCLACKLRSKSAAGLKPQPLHRWPYGSESDSHFCILRRSIANRIKIVFDCLVNFCIFSLP
jgi:hypothetical protein